MSVESNKKKENIPGCVFYYDSREQSVLVERGTISEMIKNQSETIDTDYEEVKPKLLNNPEE